MVLDLYASTNGGSTNDPFDWLITRWVFAQKGTDLERINERLLAEVQGIKLMKGGGQPPEGLGMPINYTEIVPYSEKDNHTENVPYSEKDIDTAPGIAEAIHNFEEDVNNFIKYKNTLKGEDYKTLIFFFVKAIKAISLLTEKAGAKAGYVSSVLFIRLCNIFTRIALVLITTPLGQILLIILVGYYIFYSPDSYAQKLRQDIITWLTIKTFALFAQYQEPILGFLGNIFPQYQEPILGFFKPIMNDLAQEITPRVTQDVTQEVLPLLEVLQTNMAELAAQPLQEQETNMVQKAFFSIASSPQVIERLITYGAEKIPLLTGGKKNTKRKKKTRGKTKGKKRRRKTKKKL